MGTTLSLSNVTKAFGATPVLADINLAIGRGEFVSLLGPSGCGKSTLLRIVAGFEAQDRGVVAIEGASVDHLPPRDRNLAMVFQSYALYPHMTVGQNISLPLEMGRLSALQRLPLLGRFTPGARQAYGEIDARARQAAGTVEIGHLLDRRPAQLSGGQRQRVALARAMVREPGLFLMDEPLSNLDAKLRVAMRSELVGLNKRLGATMLYVTHDQVEAMTMSDRIALMMDGRVLQFDTPAALYNSPAHLDVARFIGQPAINCLPAEARGTLVLPEAETVRLAAPGEAGSVTLALRPEGLSLSNRPEPQAMLSIAASIERVELLGAEVLVWCVARATGRRLVVQSRAADYYALQEAGALAGPLWLEAAEPGIHLFDHAGAAMPLHGAAAKPRRPAMAAVS